MPPRSRPPQKTDEEDLPLIDESGDGDADSALIDETRARILSAVRSPLPQQATHADRNPTSGDVDRAARELLGDAYVRRGDLPSARKAYVAGQVAHKVAAVDAAMAPKGVPVTAASSEPAQTVPQTRDQSQPALSEEECIVWLSKAEGELQRGRTEMAISALRKAAAWERLVALGDELLQRDDDAARKLAFRAYRLAGAFDRINANAERYPGGAIRAYMATGARDALRIYCDAVMDGPGWRLKSMGLLFDLYKAYRYLGGSRERFLQIGECFVAIEHPLALTVFRAAAKMKLEAECRQEPS